MGEPLPVDPFEISAEELEERLGSVEGATLRAALIEVGFAMPRAKLTVESLLAMESLPQLALALSVLTREELHWALLAFLHSWYQDRLDEAAFAAWQDGSAP
jgi:hypothetical protein